jgi:hypothetical protein
MNMATKHKFAKPRKKILDQAKVSIYLKTIDFQPKKIIQEWRHLIAFGNFQNKKAVFKLASTLTTAQTTQNEFYWNEAVLLTPQNSRLNFTVPQNYSSGQYNKLFYFIAEWFTQPPLITTHSTDTSKLSPFIHQIALATYELENLPISNNCNFAQSSKSKRQKQTPIGHRLLASTTEWASQVPLDLSKFVYEVEKTKNNLKTCVGHGDYVPRQMYLVQNKIGIIDGEHAGLKGPLYYDAAQFYIRLRLDHKAATLAKKYLLEFKKLLSKSNQEKFWQDLKPVLIQRYVGDLWGAKANPKKLTDLSLLGKEILDDKII